MRCLQRGSHSFLNRAGIFMMAYIGVALQHSHFMTLREFSYVIAAGFVGMFSHTPQAPFCMHSKKKSGIRFFSTTGDSSLE